MAAEGLANIQTHGPTPRIAPSCTHTKYKNTQTTCTEGWVGFCSRLLSPAMMGQIQDDAA